MLAITLCINFSGYVHKKFKYKSYLTAMEQRQGRGQDHQKQMSLTGSVALENLLDVCLHICPGADNTIPKPQKLVEG